jgi:hypothetical protein
MIFTLSTKNILILFFIVGIMIILSYQEKYEFFKYSNSDFVETFSSVQKMIQEINIPYAIIYGTALGAYRNGDFIPHDDDIDIMIFHDDLKKLGHKTLEEQQKYFNTIAKKYNLIPRKENSAPYMYVENNMRMPILYQYAHEKTNIGVDFYIFYNYKNNYWNFCDGGEYDFKGYKYPIKESFFKTKLNMFDVISCPVDYLYISYGPKMNTPVQKGEKNYYKEDREFFGPFLKEWLLPLK